MSSVVSSLALVLSSLRRYERKERHVEGELEAGRLWERAQPRGALLLSRQNRSPNGQSSLLGCGASQQQPDPAKHKIMPIPRPSRPPSLHPISFSGILSGRILQIIQSPTHQFNSTSNPDIQSRKFIQNPDLHVSGRIRSHGLVTPMLLFLRESAKSDWQCKIVLAARLSQRNSNTIQS